jgi:hypothetical protein
MASRNVVHMDIRFDPDQWGFSNVLCIQNEGREAPVELALIDFESLTNCGSISSDVVQDFVISPQNVGRPARAYWFVFWQVLYAAYLWSTEPSHTLQIAWRFVGELFASDGTGTTVKDGDLLTSFRARMGEDAIDKLSDIWGRLSGLEGGDSSAAASIVQEAMGVIQKRFEAELGPAESWLVLHPKKGQGSPGRRQVDEAQ